LSAPVLISDPLVSALRFATAPYARGAATLDLQLAPAAAGLSNFEGYTFAVFQSSFGVQTEDLSVSYVITLRAPLGDGPVALGIGYTNDAGSGTARVLVPAGTLPGTAFVIPTPSGGGVVLLQTLQERPAPALGAPSGPDKWEATALLGNTARLLALILGERQVIAATGRDILDQRYLLTARAWSLDLVGDALGVPRLLPAAYRLDLDTSVVALYHLDDVIGPVVDATDEHPGVSHVTKRGVAGKMNNAAQITEAGGITVPDDLDFAVPAGTSFTVEMFAQLPRLEEGSTLTMAVKRSHADDPNGPGWALTAKAVDAETGTLSFAMTDRLGTMVEAVSKAAVSLTSWFHVAGVLNGPARTLSLFVNGAVAGSTPFDALSDVQNCADIGLGADRTGTAMMPAGFLDEVRFSRTARSSFTDVLGGTPYVPDADTIALYHLDETDDLIDEVTGRHYATNRGATRGVPARFSNGVRFTGDPLPETHCASEIAFQQQLRESTWDRTQGGAVVTAGPYTRFGYKQGAIALPGLTRDPQPVFVNDAATISAQARGLLTTACYGFVPTDLDGTIASLQAAGRSVQEAIDYFGEWNGNPDSFYTIEYAAHGITAVHEQCLPTPDAPTSILIPGDPDLVVDENSDLTVEAIIKPDAIADDYPRAVAASRSSGLREGESNANEVGWALTVCGCECIPNNVQWTLGDAAGNLVTVLAGVNVADGSFHHVAGVLDRDTGSALLFIDGVEVAKEPLGALGAVGGASDVTLGNDPLLNAPYAGVIDEVRISRAARHSFHPVLGESDERYRQRLAIFTPYRLPSSLMLQRGIRALSLPTSSTADEVAERATTLLLSYGDAAEDGQLDVLETDSARFCTSRDFRILPARLQPGQSIANDGTMPADEADATGTYTFHQEALIRHDDMPGLSFPSEQARWMILRAAQGLDALVDAVQTASAGTEILVQQAWVSTTQLHSEGRSLDITNSSPGPRMDLGLIAAMAHQIGVEYVAYDVAAGFVRLSFAAGSDLEITAAGVVARGGSLELVVSRPVLANPALLQFRLVRCGSGDGTLSSDAVTGPTGRLFTGTALGQITVVVQYSLVGGAMLSGSREITIAPDTLDGCTTIDSSGKTGVSEADASGAPDSDFQEAYLISSNVANVSYESADAHRMQLPLDKALRTLESLAAAEPGSPQISVLAAFDPLAETLQAVGRGLVIAPSDTTLTAGRLGALAYRSGFAYVERRRHPASVYVSVAPGPRFEIVRSPNQRLWANARMSGLGEFMATEFAAAGPPDPGFTVASLQTYTNVGVVFAAGVNNQVQATLAASLDALVAQLTTDGIAGGVKVAVGFDPAAVDLTSVGRAVLMRHPAVTADRLSGYALAAGFGFVQHQPNATGGPAVYAAAYSANSAPPNVFDDDDLILKVLAEISVQPQLPITGDLTWCLTPCCGAAASLSTALPAPGATGLALHKILSGTQFGSVRADASFSLNDAAQPYQFIVKSHLLDGVEPKLTKDQYDDLLNFIATYYPVGVEAITRGIRGFVHGFARPPGWSQLPTSATFPRYRMQR
jgi:hypothetical protein